MCEIPHIVVTTHWGEQRHVLHRSRVKVNIKSVKTGEELLDVMAHEAAAFIAVDMSTIYSAYAKGGLVNHEWEVTRI